MGHKSQLRPFEFAHKSIQEFLTADYIVKLPYLPEGRRLLYLPDELAICVAISSDPTNFLFMLAFEVLTREELDISFLGSFIDRIIIENVDFRISPALSLSVLQITTAFLRKGYSPDEIDLIRFLNRFPQVRISLFELRSYCKVLDELPMEPLGEGVLILDTLNIPIRNMKGISIPDKLLALEGFVEGW